MLMDLLLPVDDDYSNMVKLKALSYRRIEIAVVMYGMTTAVDPAASHGNL